MLYAHCSFCGNLNLKTIEGSIKKCLRCDWEGVPDRNSMEDINKFARSYRPGNKAPLTRAAPKNVDLDDNEDSIESESEPEQKNCLEDCPKPSQEEAPQQVAPKAADPRKSSFRMDDKEAATSQNLLANKQVSDKSPKNKELIERLKNKSIRGADFM